MFYFAPEWFAFSPHAKFQFWQNYIWQGRGPEITSERNSIGTEGFVYMTHILYFASALFGFYPRAKFWIWKCFIWRRHFFDLLAKFKTRNIKT